MINNPINFRNVELPNRWVMSPMCMYSALDGLVNAFHQTHYLSRAIGGVGLIIFEATGIVPEGRISNRCLGLWNEEQQSELQKINQLIKQYSKSKTGIQLAHSGRKGSTDKMGKTLVGDEAWELIAPSAIAFSDKYPTPRALTVSEIKDLIQSFKNAAQRAVNADFDIVELHAAHGYLIHQFLSPISNQRTDEYGGSFENRIRFLLEIVKEVNCVLDDKHPLFVRISATDYHEEGWNLEESIELAKILKEHQIDLIDVSSGGNYADAKITLFDGYQVSFSEQIRKEAKIPTGAVGLIKDSKQVKEILVNQQADLVFLGRALLRNPYLPINQGDDAKDFIPEQYKRAF